MIDVAIDTSADKLDGAKAIVNEFGINLKEIEGQNRFNSKKVPEQQAALDTHAQLVGTKVKITNKQFYSFKRKA